MRRLIDAFNRRDWDALLEGLDPEVEWHGARDIPWEGEAAVYRGHEDVRQWFEELEEVFPDVHSEFPEIRDLGDRIVAIGKIGTRGAVSGAATESRPVAYVIDYENGKATRIWSYMDPAEALAAVGLSE